MTRLSCTIRAHPSRIELVDALVHRLGVDYGQVVWDRDNDSWDTGRRAWLAHDPDADWHLVLEDDALPCQDLLDGLRTALAALPAESVASLYSGDTGPVARKLTRTATSSIGGWVQADKLVWGVAIVAPTRSIAGMVDWCDRQRRYSSTVYDTRIARYYQTIHRWPAFHAWPSLVDHRQVPSLLGHPQGRQAIRFIGEHASAADWAKGT